MTDSIERLKTPALPDFVRHLAYAFHRAGEQLYVVGGAVRDRILRREDFDLDFATSAHPSRTAEILGEIGMGHTYRVGEKFGTIGAHLGDGQIEITTFRSGERYGPDSRKPEVHFGSSLLEDLQRRDFTINAMALDPVSGEVIDPFHGRSDLARRLIRAVGDPEVRFDEDPLRILRAVRFAAGLGFNIDPATQAAMRKLAPRLSVIARERIRDECSRILTGTGPVAGLTLLRDAGLLAESVPELLELTGMPDHGPGHPLSLWDHSMRVVASVPPDLVIRWAAVLHDIAKPRTRRHTDDGRTRFFHHDEVGADLARQALRGLRYPNGLVGDVSTLVETHMQLHAYSPEWSDGAIRRLVLRLGPLVPEALALARADAAGHSRSGQAAGATKLDRLEERIAELGDERPELFRSPLSGEELMERYNRPPGPWIRRIKEALREEVLDGRLSPQDRLAAWRLADELSASDSEHW